MIVRPPRSTLLPYTPRFRSRDHPARSPGMLVMPRAEEIVAVAVTVRRATTIGVGVGAMIMTMSGMARRSEEHTSELQPRQYLVCRLLLAKTAKPPKMRNTSL